MSMLDDIRILDFSHVYFGPYSTMILADMGADVIKIEPPWGEGIRGSPARGMSSAFLYLNRNKKGMTLNLKNPKAVEIALRLAEKSDVVVENFKTGTMDKLGLGYEEIRKVKPDIIYASLSGYGLDGPYASRPSYAPMAGSISGWYRLTGDTIDPEGAPIKPSEMHGDFDPGLFATISILGALRHRDKNGEGQLIDAAQLDCMIAQTGVSITSYTRSGELPWRSRARTDLTTIGMVKAEDGWVYIASDARILERLKRARGVEVLDKTEQLREWVAARKVDDIVENLTAISIPAAPVLQVDQTLEDPHVKARGIITTIEHPTEGTVRSPGFPVKLSRTPATIRLPAPQLGEHNEEVLTQLLDYSKEEVEELRKEGVIT